METKELIRQIIETTRLEFVETLEVGNLCFRQNNSDLQDDFKEIFTQVDLNFYLHSFGESEVLAPKDAKEFWERVRSGMNLD